MTRGVGAIHLLQGVIPHWLVPIWAAITDLGSIPFMLVLVPLLYWFGTERGLFRDRTDAELLVGIALGALGLVVALKTAFALPRPPQTLHLVAASGYGFPSGHATATTAIYGGLFALLDRWSRRTRAAAFGGLVGLVALSRVALGVHYLVDVVVGFLVGGSFLLVVLRFWRDEPGRPIWLAVGFAVLGVAAAWLHGFGLTADTAQALGGTLGAALAWSWVARRSVDPRVSLPHGVVALVAVGVLKGASHVLAPPLPVVLLVNGVILAVVVALPALDGWPGSTKTETSGSV